VNSAPFYKTFSPLFTSFRNKLVRFWRVNVGQHGGRAPASSSLGRGFVSSLCRGDGLCLTEMVYPSIIFYTCKLRVKRFSRIGHRTSKKCIHNPPWLCCTLCLLHKIGCHDVCPTWHLTNVTFCQLAILPTSYYCPIAVSSTCHFVNLPLYQLTILLHCHFVNLPYGQFVIWQTHHLAYLPLC
jgi:hypothetical protein